jgi:hypothetical protein
VPTDGSLPSVTTAKKYGNNIFIYYNLASLTPAKVKAYSDAGMRVWIFTMDTVPEYDKALALGAVYAWQVDDLLTAKEYLAP